MSDHGIRNIDQLLEEEARPMPRSVTLTFVAVGGACVLFSVLAVAGRTSHPPSPKSDPLGELVARRMVAPPGSSSARAMTSLSPSDVTFPHMLSDADRPTTALAAVRAGAGTGGDVVMASMPMRPPPPTDRLPVVPLPPQAGTFDEAPRIASSHEPSAKPSTDGAPAAAPPESGDTASPGHEGGYQLQVSSFRTRAEADAFAEQLRARDHKAYVTQAHVPQRGVWFRVRIGPFATQHAATEYRSHFEAREHVVPFIVPPDTTAKSH